MPIILGQQTIPDAFLHKGFTTEARWISSEDSASGDCRRWLRGDSEAGILVAMLTGVRPTMLANREMRSGEPWHPWIRVVPDRK